MHGRPRTDRPVSDPFDPGHRRVRRRPVGLRRRARRSHRHQGAAAWSTRTTPKPAGDSFARHNSCDRVNNAHVIVVYDIGALDDGRPFFVMELASGGVLADRVEPGGIADAEGVRAMIVAARERARRAPCREHRAPRREAGEPADRRRCHGNRHRFGNRGATWSSRPWESEASSATSGSPRIRIEPPSDRRSWAARRITGLPNKRRRNAEIGPPADVFAATAVLWNLLTGDVPAASESLDAQLATVPPAWREVFLRGLAPEPDERFATMPEWEAAALGALDDATGRVTVGFRTATPGTTCPYKGLASFQPEDAPFFFGREALVDELVARLQTAWTLVIGGPSGSGKSSLLRAGLVPSIAAGRVARQPALADRDLHSGRGRDEGACLSARPVPPGGTRRPLRRSCAMTRSASDGFLSSADSRLARHRPVRRTAHARHRRSPIGTRSSMCWRPWPRQPARTIRVVLGLRSDFYSACADYAWLADRISANQVLVGPMPPG